MGTLFESILSGQIPSHCVAQGESWYAFLDIFPRREGHTLVIPRKPAQRLSELSPDELSGLMEGITVVQQRLGAHFSTTDFTICLHDGPLAGQEVPHVHFHVIPRNEGDGGETLMSMWPKTINTEPNHESLASLATSLQGVI
ncbi:MAG: HIT family protein [Candidatus Poseidoniales archaeon]|nr:MAG: HIT family protein [Candidatus Poseidoniales archaeon]